MKIRMLTPMAGIDFVHNVGDVVDLPEEAAIRLLQRGSAERVEPETATLAPSKRDASKNKRHKRETRGD